jgi:hypothetical protein
VFYRVRPERIEVVRVLHGARDVAGLLANEVTGDAPEEERQDD